MEEGLGWLHEINHDGFRILARRDGARRAADAPGSVPEKHQKENANYDNDDGESYQRRPTAVRLLILPGETVLICRVVLLRHGVPSRTILVCEVSRLRSQPAIYHGTGATFRILARSVS